MYMYIYSTSAIATVHQGASEHQPSFLKTSCRALHVMVNKSEVSGLCELTGVSSFDKADVYRLGHVSLAE
jgi:hypothetical protein